MMILGRVCLWYLWVQEEAQEGLVSLFGTLKTIESTQTMQLLSLELKKSYTMLLDPHAALQINTGTIFFLAFFKCSSQQFSRLTFAEFFKFKTDINEYLLGNISSCHSGRIHGQSAFPRVLESSVLLESHQ
jgi:hypothetical protein